MQEAVSNGGINETKKKKFKNAWGIWYQLPIRFKVFLVKLELKRINF